MSQNYNDTLRSSYSSLQGSGPDWAVKQVPRQDIQIVPLSPPVSYSTLSHDSPPSSSGYFSIQTAYNETFPNQDSGYVFYNRTCDGGLLQPTLPPNHGSKTTLPSTFPPHYEW